MHDPGRHTCDGAGCESNPYLEMAMLSEQPGYRSYLLRLWRIGTGEPPSWRASLEDARTHQRRNFASLEQLYTFLIDETDGAPESDDAVSEANKEAQDATNPSHAIDASV